MSNLRSEILRSLLAIFLMSTMLTSFGQSISVRPKKSSSDIKVLNGQYQLYFTKADLVNGIVQIDKLLQTDHVQLISSLKENKVGVINLNAPSDSLFTELFNSNLGSYLLSRGLAAIEKEGKPVTIIEADESPEMREENGVTNVSIFFSEEGVNEPVFMGKLNTELKVRKTGDDMPN